MFEKYENDVIYREKEEAQQEFLHKIEEEIDGFNENGQSVCNFMISFFFLWESGNNGLWYRVV